jgi:hypothetical protein
MILPMTQQVASSEGRWQIGAHSLWEAAPDVVRLDLVGLVEGHELKEIVELEHAWARGKPQWFAIADLSRLGGSTPSSRAYMAEVPPHAASVSIVFGTHFAVRILVEMMMRARRLLKPSEPEVFIVVATEADAWAEVERRRKARK